jgi:hypothetical protein
MPRARKQSSPLDHPIIWRGLVKRLALGSGPYVELHDAILIQEFCDAFNIPLSAVSERLRAYVHAPSDTVN